MLIVFTTVIFNNIPAYFALFIESPLSTSTFVGL